MIEIARLSVAAWFLLLPVVVAGGRRSRSGKLQPTNHGRTHHEMEVRTTVAAGMVMSLFAGRAKPRRLAPVRRDVTSGTVVPGTFLGVAGNCMQAGDKIFGNFAGSGGTGAVAASFTFSAPNGNVTLGITDAIGPSSTATLDYQVAVTPAAIALGWRIDDLTKDFTLNRLIPSPRSPPLARPSQGPPLTCLLSTSLAPGTIRQQ